MTPWLDDGDVVLYHGDACDVLATLPAKSVQTVVTTSLWVMGKWVIRP